MSAPKSVPAAGCLYKQPCARKDAHVPPRGGGGGGGGGRWSIAVAFCGKGVHWFVIQCIILWAEYRKA